MQSQKAAQCAGIDALKLDALRDKYARLHASYKAAAERARDLAKDASLLVMEAGFEADADLGSVILSRDADALAVTTPEELELARLDARLVRRVVTAKAAAARQRAEVASLADELRDSTQLITSLNEHAKRFEASL